MLFNLSFLSVEANYITSKQQLSRCYNGLSSIHLYKNNNTICVTLSSNEEDECNVLPKGMEVQVTLNKFASKILSYVYDFSYNTSKHICMPCPDCAGTDFYKSTLATVDLMSV